jgi:hypothetical protein
LQDSAAVGMGKLEKWVVAVTGGNSGIALANGNATP